MENRDDQNKNQGAQQGQQFTDKQNQQGQTSTGQTGLGPRRLRPSGDDTTLAQGQKNLTDKQREDEAASDKGFVGSNKEDSSDAYLSKDATGQTDFAETGQGATEAQTDEDIESGTPRTRDAALDDGS